MIQINSDRLPELARKHYEAIDAFFNRPKNRVNKYESPRMDALKDLLGGVDGIKKAILAKPSELQELAERIGTYNVDESDDLAIFVRFYKDFISPSNTNDRWDYNFTEALTAIGVEVCPYCNNNYVYRFEGDDGNERTYQLDHFYPKDLYPYLAISFYNLLPACADCNRLKGVKAMSINPYDTNRSLASSFKFRFRIEEANIFKRDPNVVSIGYQFNDQAAENSFNEHNKAVFLTQRYKHRKDLVLEAIHKKQMYSDEYIDQLYAKYKGTIFTSKEDVLRYVSGNYVTDDGFLKRPFSKLNKDIWEQLDE